MTIIPCRASAIGAVVFAGIVVATTALASPSVYPTGTTIYDPVKAYNSYVVFGSPDGKTHLIDLAGNEVHRWEKWGFPSEIIDPAINGGKKGQLLVQLSSYDTGPFGKIFFNETVGELDWNGNVVWEWGKQAPGGKARQNHDWARLPNGDTIIVATVDRVVPGISKKSVGDQVLYEITPAGEIVWRWYVADHINEFGITPEGLKQIRHYLANGDHGHGFLTINDMQPIGPNKWFDAGDKRFDPENIVIDSRNASFIAIIDKKSGKIVWRIGPDYDADVHDKPFSAALGWNVPRPVDHTVGQHDAHIIPKGFPGEGNILVFDNEGVAGFPVKKTINGSRVLEINPITKEVVWQYSGLDSNTPTWSFYSSFISSAQRLPNGNTLIDEGQNGRIFQVTPSGEIVWEYVNPYFTEEQLTDGHETKSKGAEVKTNWVFRAQPVPYSWVPDGTPHSEAPVKPVDVSKFRVP